jgi:hypothetical protein
VKTPENVSRCPECERMLPVSKMNKGRCQKRKACAKARAAMLKVEAENRDGVHLKERDYDYPVPPRPRQPSPYWWEK